MGAKVKIQTETVKVKDAPAKKSQRVDIGPARYEQIKGMKTFKGAKAPDYGFKKWSYKEPVNP